MVSDGVARSSGHTVHRVECCEHFYTLTTTRGQFRALCAHRVSRSECAAQAVFLSPVQ